jgi:hypothetical protein
VQAGTQQAAWQHTAPQWLLLLQHSLFAAAVADFVVDRAAKASTKVPNTNSVCRMAPPE